MEITVTEEWKEYVTSKIASGRYSSVTEVFVAGLESLRTEEETIEQWLIDDVVPALDELKANPGLGIPIEIAFAEIRDQYALRKKSRA